VKTTNGQVNSLVYGKNELNWAIRSQVPKPVLVGQGKGSETKWLSVTSDSLTNLM
jgi:hypothetical protein